MSEDKLNANETPTLYSERIAKEYSNGVSKEQKKDLGQFFTPLSIAEFMASIADVNLQKRKIKILDPGCGTLTLSCALVEFILRKNNKIEEIIIDAFDTDQSLNPIVRRVSKKIKDWGIQRGVKIIVNFNNSDFLLTNLKILSKSNRSRKYDYVIANPPYFKISKKDPRLAVFDESLQGQQNIYSLFLLASAKSLKSNGQLIYLIPRSFTSGLYFQSFRNHFFKIASLQFLHLFTSRKDGFKKDDVLQENLILKARIKSKRKEPKIIISTSYGISDLSQSTANVYDKNQLVKRLGKLEVLHLPVTRSEEDAIKLFSSWKESLSKFGMRVSTGPVVPFRSKKYLRHSGANTKNCVPLLWMHNCFKMEMRWPNKKADKEDWIIENIQSDSKTIKNENYVLLRRFSSKDDKSKLIATPHIKSNFGFEKMGIENHLNYLHMPNGTIEDVIIYGLSTLFNSAIFDAYLRSLIGNTQVSATELNSIPLPSMETIRLIGIKYLSLNGQGIIEIDNIVNSVLK